MNVQNLLALAEDLIEKGFVIETRALRTQKGAGNEELVEVGDTGPLVGSLAAENSANFYLDVIRQARFSWLLFDASAVQIKYRRRGDEVLEHRYCYIPAPFRIDLRNQSSGYELLELLEGRVTSDPLNQAHRAAIRFECDPGAKSETHPSSHLHLNEGECRIPVRAPFTVKEFVSFIAKFFYASYFEPQALAVPQFRVGNTLSDVEERFFHISWRPI